MAKILYNNGKWDGVWNLPKYQEIREKIVDAFKDLTFVEEGHKYYLHGNEITCVSNVIHQFQEHFDARQKAIETSERHFNDESSIYFGKTPKEIEKMWEENSKNACEHGTERHEFSESCFYFMTRQYDKILPQFKDRLLSDNEFLAKYPKEEAAASFYEDMPSCIIPILAETKVYDERLKYSGTFDLLCYYDAELDGRNSDNSGLMVLDWKTNKNLYKNFGGKTLLYPFEGLLDSPVSIYKLQLSLYQNALENIGMKVIARRLMWLKPDGTYDKIPLEEYTKKLRETLSEQK